MSRLTKWFRKPTRPERRQPVRLGVETLEDRLVPSVNLPTDLAQIPYRSPNGPTQLGICFEGSAPYSDGGYLGIGQTTYQVGAYNAGTPTLTDQNIQDMIFRVSEIYTPFNVQVSRLLGYNDYWNGSNTQGPETVFVGPGMGAGVTPGSFSDYPSLGNMNDVRHSEPYHLSYVDPNQGNFGNITGAAESIAHEAGHTFGLWHVRTDQLSDPKPLNTPAETVPDIMSYNRGTSLEYFADQSLNLTAWNQTSGGPILQGASMPMWAQSGWVPQIVPTTQDSFYCLSQVLGARPADGRYHVADIGAIDPQYQGQFVHPASDDMNAADAIITEQGTIFRQGDYDVYRWTAPATETIRVSLAGQGGLSPLLMVYDNSGQLQWTNGGSKPANSSDILKSDTGNNLLYIQDSFGGRSTLQGGGAPAGSLNVQANTSYYFVVGAQDSNSTGSYQLGINQLPAWAQLSGTTLSINGNVLGANATEALSIDSNGGLRVTLNGTTAQFEPGQVSAINVNSLGGNNQINLAPGIQNLGSLPSQITVAAGVHTALTVHDNNNAAAATYSVTATGLNRAIGGQPLFRVTYGDLTSLTLDTGLAPDTVNIDTIPAPTTVVGGPLFTDQFNIGATSHSLDGLGSSSLTLDGGGGGATVVLNDASHNNATDILLQYTVTSSTLQRSEMYWDPATGFDDSSFVTVNYSRVNHLELDGSTWFPALVNVEGTSAPTDIHGGSQVIVAPTSQTLNSINGLLSIFGGYLTIDDMVNPYWRGVGATVSYAVDSVSLSRSVGFLGRPPAVATVIQYIGLSGLTLDTCIASNKVVVSGTPAPTTINCGAADAVIVGDFLGTLGTLTVNGHGGTVTLDDSVTANSDGPIGGMDGTQSFAVGFTVTDQSVAYYAHEVERYYYEPPNGGLGKWIRTTANFYSTFHYANVSALTIDGGPVDNSFGVQSTPAGMKLTLNGSTGQEVNGAPTFNHFTVGNSGSVKNIRSQLVFNGSGPADTVLLDDSAATTQDIVTMTPAQVGMGALDEFFAAGGGLTYNGISALTLNLSAAYDDKVHLTPSAVTAFFLKANESEWQAGHGAILDLDPADAPYATDHPTGLDAGYLTFSNGKKSATYSGFAQY